MSKLIVSMLLGEIEGDQRQCLVIGADDLKLAERLDVLGQRLGVRLHDLHDPPVSRLAEADEVVVLRQHHRRAGREVEGEGVIGLAELVLLEDQILGEVGSLPEDQPADPRIDHPELVTRGVDRADLLEAEVPLGVRIEKGPDEGPARAIDMEGDIHAFLASQRSSRSLMPTTSSACPVKVVPTTAATPIVFSSTCGSTSSGPIVYLPACSGTILGSTSKYRQNFSQTTCTSPPKTRFGVGRLAIGLAALAPLPLQRKRPEHDRLRGALSPRASGLAGSVEELGKHPDAALLDLGGDRVLGVIDEVPVQVSSITTRASGSMKVVTKVARFRSGIPSTTSS